MEKSYEVIEKKRGELLNPVRSQRNQLIEDIDASHRQLQAAQAIISGHLASVRNVHDAQNDVLKTVGLEGMREKLSENTEKVSNRISCLIEEAEKRECSEFCVTVSVLGSASAPAEVKVRSENGPSISHVGGVDFCWSGVPGTIFSICK
ncbi:MAG: hypothetical protein HUN05_19030 [Desulfobacter sp.]|nr:MAG: hypothetical protein HUN05_19030 [Desulfobacter sp.]